MCEGLGVRWVMSSKFISSLQAAFNVCLCYMFGQRCLMGCPSLPGQYYHLTCFSTSFSSILFSFSYSMFCHIIFHSVRQTFTLFLISEYLFTIMFVFFLFFPSPLVLWHICCCLVGRLCSPVINLFCRSPSALCLPLLLLLHLLSVAYFSSYMRASLHWHLMHGSLTPPPPIANLSPFRLLQLSHTLSSPKRWEGCISVCVIDMLCKDTCQQQANCSSS